MLTALHSAQNVKAKDLSNIQQVRGEKSERARLPFPL